MSELLDATLAYVYADDFATQRFAEWLAVGRTNWRHRLKARIRLAEALQARQVAESRLRTLVSTEG